MIDGDGYRPNVGIVICNSHGQVFWARRYGQHSWQFPQGGIDDGETPEQAMFRELYEEVGLTKKDVRIIASSRHWLRYKLPKRLVRWDSKPVCIGQKQKWFLFKFLGTNRDINISTEHPEFSNWKWMPKENLLEEIVPFKKSVYESVLREFERI